MCAAGNVICVDSGSGVSTWLDSAGFEANRRESRALRQQSAQARASARAIREQVRRGRPQREILYHSAFARLRARQETLAVIEQAKGIIMVQQRCGPDEAFDLLRRVSQQVNMKLRVLAAQIVEHVTASDLGNVTPFTVGTRRYRGW